MNNYPYVKVQSKLTSFLEDVQRLGVPEKVSQNWLKTVGYTSSNDISIPRVLEYIGFIDSSRQPTDNWKKYRDKYSSGLVLATAIREGYDELYQVYPDAQLRNDEDLKNFFRARTETGEQTVRRTANTFKTLCSLADFGQMLESVAVTEGASAPIPSAGAAPQQRVAHQALTPSLKVDVQIHIAANTDKTQIEEIFKSMAKYLYNMDVEEQKGREEPVKGGNVPA